MAMDNEWPAAVVATLDGKAPTELLTLIKDMDPEHLAAHIVNNSASYKDAISKAAGWKAMSLGMRTNFEGALMKQFAPPPNQPYQQPPIGGAMQQQPHPQQKDPTKQAWTQQEFETFRADLPPDSKSFAATSGSRD